VGPFRGPSESTFASLIVKSGREPFDRLWMLALEGILSHGAIISTAMGQMTATALTKWVGDLN
jgi:hypothetical protein